MDVDRGGAWWRRRGCSVAYVNADGAAAEDGAGTLLSHIAVRHLWNIPLTIKDLPLIYTQTGAFFSPFLFISPLTSAHQSTSRICLLAQHPVSSVSSGEGTKISFKTQRKTHSPRGFSLCWTVLSPLRSVWTKTITVSLFFLHFSRWFLFPLSPCAGMDERHEWMCGNTDVRRRRYFRSRILWFLQTYLGKQIQSVVIIENVSVKEHFTEMHGPHPRRAERVWLF